jgi:hypothetical protein
MNQEIECANVAEHDCNMESAPKVQESDMEINPDRLVYGDSSRSRESSRKPR